MATFVAFTCFGLAIWMLVCFAPRTAHLVPIEGSIAYDTFLTSESNETRAYVPTARLYLASDPWPLYSCHRRICKWQGEARNTPTLTPDEASLVTTSDREWLMLGCETCREYTASWRHLQMLLYTFTILACMILLVCGGMSCCLCTRKTVQIMRLESREHLLGRAYYGLASD
jgi:hypothetical protein